MDVNRVDVTELLLSEQDNVVNDDLIHLVTTFPSITLEQKHDTKSKSETHNRFNSHSRRLPKINERFAANKVIIENPAY